jgi:uncharacterized protein YndB with AHSA1/START domain
VGLDFSLEREYAVGTDRVWSYLTDPELLATWFCPNPSLAVSCSLDVQPGGVWRCAMGPYVVGGAYRDVSPPHELAFTWGWEHAPEEPTTTVTITLAPTASGTRLVLGHAEVEADAGDDGHEGGWVRSLDRLDEALAH